MTPCFFPPLPPRFSHLNSDKVFPSIWMRNFFYYSPCILRTKKHQLPFSQTERAKEHNITKGASSSLFLWAFAWRKGCRRVWMDPPAAVFLFSPSFLCQLGGGRFIIFFPPFIRASSWLFLRPIFHARKKTFKDAPSIPFLFAV